MSAPPEDPADVRADEADRVLGLVARQPAHNVFAQRDIETHRHRLRSNAFYQAEMLKRKNLPPDTVHHTFTDPYLSDFATPPPPPMDQSRYQRASSHASTSNGHTQSPPINLGTSPDRTPHPTQRAVMEERSEFRRHVSSGSTDERTPIFTSHRPTPKPDAGGFGNTPTGKMTQVKFAETDDVAPTVGSARKGFFGNMISRIGGRRGTTPQALTSTTDIPESRMPPKAEAVLGPKTPKKPLGRSPSKTKAFFSRRKSDLADVLSGSTDETKPAAATIATAATPRSADTPRSASSLGFHNGRPLKSALAKRSVSRAESNSGADDLSSKTPVPPRRTQSLTYMDSAVPPTPPQKDTPPDEKAIRNASAHKDPIVPFQTTTPNRSEGFVSTDHRLSPSKQGHYGHRTNAQLASAPSVHSFRASVVPDGIEHSDVDAARARLAGLGLEGMEQTQRPPHMYSPSVYSPDQGRRSMSTFPRVSRVEEELDEEDRQNASPSMPMKDVRASDVTDATSGTIEIVYPELAQDPSIAKFMKYEPGSPSPAGRSAPSSSPNWRNASGASFELDSMLQTPTPAARKETARPTSHQDLLAGEETSSPMANHPSAQVSPLHPQLETLQPTFYTPPGHKVAYSPDEYLAPNFTGKAAAQTAAPMARLPRSRLEEYKPDTRDLDVGQIAKALRLFRASPLMDDNDVDVDPQKTSPPQRPPRREPSGNSPQTFRTVPSRTNQGSSHTARREPTDSSPQAFRTSASRTSRTSQDPSPTGRRVASKKQPARRALHDDSGIELSSASDVPDSDVTPRKLARHKRISTAVAEDFYRSAPAPAARPKDDEAEEEKATLKQLRVQLQQQAAMMEAMMEEIRDLQRGQEGREGRGDWL